MLKLKDVMRSGHVTRWQIVRTARHQTLAEHSYLVTLIAQHLWRLLMAGSPYLVKADELLLMQWALRHDLPEVMTGDIATPLKRRLRKLVEYDPILKIERDIDSEYSLLHNRVKDTPIEGIVKIADLLEGIIFLQTEGIGPHAQKVLDKLKERYDQTIVKMYKKFPLHAWTLCNGVLDDLLNGDDGMMEIENE